MLYCYLVTSDKCLEMIALQFLLCTYYLEFASTNLLPHYLAVPPDFEVTKITNTTIRLVWSAVPDAQNYHIAYRKSGTNKFGVAFSSTTEKEISNLAPLTEYEIKIQVGLSPYDPGKWSDPKLVKTNPGKTPFI